MGLKENLQKRLELELNALSSQAQSEQWHHLTLGQLYMNLLESDRPVVLDPITGIQYGEMRPHQPQHPEVTVVDALYALQQSQEKLIDEVLHTIHTLAEWTIDEEHLRERALLRESLSDRWPWSYTLDSELAMLISFLQRQTIRQLPYTWLIYWPKEAAPQTVWNWIVHKLDEHQLLETLKLMGKPVRDSELPAIEGATKGHRTRRKNLRVKQLRERYNQLEIRPNMLVYTPKTLQTPLSVIALLYVAKEQVLDDLRVPAIAFDTDVPHSKMIDNWPITPKTKDKQDLVKKNIEESVQYGKVEIISPLINKAVQLELNIPGESNDAFVNAVHDIVGTEGLRHWAALQRLVTEQGRTGVIRWDLNQHLEICGYSKSSRESLDFRRHIVELIQMFTKLQLAVYDKNGKLRDRRPLFTVDRFIDAKEGEDDTEQSWITNAIEMRINPSLYRGAGRDPESGKLGKNWYPLPSELPEISHNRYPHAIPLGMKLANRMRRAWAENGRDYIDLTGANLLRACGIKYTTKRSARIWKQLTENINELIRRKEIERIEWLRAPETLHGVIRIYIAQWLADRTVGHLKQIAVQADPTTGADLKKWRKKQKLTQKQAAQKLKVHKNTIYLAEKKNNQKLPKSLVKKLKSIENESTKEPSTFRGEITKNTPVPGPKSQKTP